MPHPSAIRTALAVYAMAVRFTLVLMASAATLGVAARSVRAQSPSDRSSSASAEDRRAVWGDVGLGLARAAFVGRFDLVHARRGRVLGLRYSIQGDLSDGGTTDETALLIGRGAICCGGNWGFVAAGPAIISRTRTSDGRTTAGLAAEAALVSRRVPHLVLSAFANANDAHSFAGVSLALALGRLPFPPSSARQPRPAVPTRRGA